MQESKDTKFYPVVSVICRSPLIHVKVDFKLSLAPLSRHGLIFEPSGQEITQYLDYSTNVTFAAPMR
jgi:energy-converting hydrogenase Eha subunit F